MRDEYAETRKKTQSDPKTPEKNLKEQKGIEKRRNNKKNEENTPYTDDAGGRLHGDETKVLGRLILRLSLSLPLFQRLIAVSGRWSRRRSRHPYFC